jgi:hypothetical protein
MDPIAMLTAAVTATMVPVLLFLVPGMALGPLVMPGASSPLARVGRAAGVSLLVVLIECTVLARLGLLSAASVLAFTIGLSALGVLVRRPRWRVPALRPRRRAWWVAAAAGAALVLGLIVIPSHLGVRPDLLPRSSTTWYYLHLAQATADLGGFPAQLGEWGALRPFATDYLPITAHTAGALLLLPGDQLVRLEIYRVIILALAVLFATLLFRRWVSGWAALAGAILLLGTVRLDQKFDGYRPETVALALALFTLWVADRALVERDRRLAAVAIVGAAAVFLGHAEVFLILAPALVGIGVARLLVAPGGRGATLGLRRPTARLLRTPALAVAIVAGGMILGAATGWLLTGQSRVLGYAVGGGQPPDLGAARGRPGEVPAGWTFTDDPTWDFYTASVAPALDGTPPPDSFTDSLLLPRSILVVWPGLDGQTRSGFVVLGALVIAPFLAWPLLDARRRRFLLGWAIFAGLLIVGSILLYKLSHTYVPQRTGGRRLLPYLLLVPVVAMTVGLWILGRLSAPAWRGLFPGRGRAVAAALALAILTTGAVSASPRADPTTVERDPALSQAGYDAYRWMAAELPADARILANAYTDGAIAAVTGRMGIVDGRAVYLEDRAFLAESTSLCLGARVVFATPSAPGAGTFLARERVTHILVATDGPLGSDLGGYLLFDTDVAAIRADPRFHLVRDFDGGRLLLFEVVAPQASRG